jgi:hypothetical protein
LVVGSAVIVGTLPWGRHRSATSIEVGAVILARSGTTSQDRSG